MKCYNIIYTIDSAYSAAVLVEARFFKLSIKQTALVKTSPLIKIKGTCCIDQEIFVVKNIVLVAYNDKD